MYNHVLKLDLVTLQWSLVDNYGDIPGVRMGECMSIMLNQSILTHAGHTACLWQGSKLLVYGGENEHREYLSDVIIYDLETSHWTQPDIRGYIPKGRARHASAVHDDKLFIVGGLAGTETYTLDELCFLDLKTWTWSRPWSFVARFDHYAWIWGGRIWVFGGLGPDMERTGDLWWLDLNSSPAFKCVPAYGETSIHERTVTHARSNMSPFQSQQASVPGVTGYQANSSSVQVRGPLHAKAAAPGSVSSVRFVSGPNVPSPAAGTHFHAYSSGALLDFVTPGGSIRSSDCSLSALDLKSFQWQKLAEGVEIFDHSYRWSYCSVSEDGTKAWLLGCTTEPFENGGGFGEYLSDVLPLDLRKFGLLGNGSSFSPGLGKELPASDTHMSSTLSSLGADLAAMFDRPPGDGSGSDFIVTANQDIGDDGSSVSSGQLEGPRFLSETSPASTPIHVHKIVLQARWPHFNRIYKSQMAEFHTKRLHVPEPYPVVRAFLYYLYTDSIAKHEDYCKDLGDVAGLLVMAQMYDMPRLRLLCLHRLSRELDVEHAAVVWERAGAAEDEWLQRRAATYCLTHWGRVVRTEGFRQLSRRSMMDLCEVIDVEGRVVGGDELELVGGLGGGKFGVGGETSRRRALAHRGSVGDDDNDAQDDEGMEIN